MRYCVVRIENTVPKENRSIHKWNGIVFYNDSDLVRQI